MPFPPPSALPPQVEAGFPSPAADHTEGVLDLVRLVVKRPAATFFMRVAGSSMVEAGIGDGDLLVVDRSVTAREGDIVVAAVGDGLAVKRISRDGEGWVLASEGQGANIRVDPELGVELWGVVSWSFRQHCVR
ncbi:LexA family protein [Propionivibrio sp.]|uniref:LexA family protein n=1 Tax=Propionivibrio sp. TaxID=2212460 RepID=UPI003BF32518